MKKIASVLCATTMLFIMFCSTVMAQGTTDIEPRNWVVCPRCSAPVVQDIGDYIFDTGSRVDCPHGYGQDIIYEKVRMTNYECAAGCGFESSEQITLNYYVPCEHF